MATLPTAAVDALALRDDVLTIGLNQTDVQPPDSVGRSEIRSDPYLSYAQYANTNGSYIGIIDSGIRASHVLLSGRTAWVRNCVGAEYGSNCHEIWYPGEGPNDVQWNHGTGTASILVGASNSSLGSSYGGVTTKIVDSFNVYTSTGFVTSAAVAAFRAAINGGDGVIVGEIQLPQVYNDTLALAARDSYDAGAAIIAAAGNYGSSSSSVSSPGGGQRVLAVGAYESSDRSKVWDSSGRGPSWGNATRLKPEMVTITRTLAASSVSTTATLTQTGTSGSTPYVAGGAALFRDFLVYRGSCSMQLLGCDPGLVYSGLILQTYVPSGWQIDNNSGAGKFLMKRANCSAWLVSSVTVGNGLNVDIPFTLNGAYSGIEAAIYWPEGDWLGYTPNLNDVDLYIRNPANTTNLASSVRVDTPWERAVYNGSSITGTYFIRVNGYSVPYNYYNFPGARVHVVARAEVSGLCF